MGTMKNLKSIRTAKGLTQTQVAEISGVTQPTIQKIESGWDGCTLRVMNQIAEGLKVPTYKFFAESHDETLDLIGNAYNLLSDEAKITWQDMAKAALNRVESAK